MTKLIHDQILEVRDTGETNMFDIYGVQRVAYNHGLHELVVYLDSRENRSEYSHFIVTGEAEINE